MRTLRIEDVTMEVIGVLENNMYAGVDNSIYILAKLRKNSAD